MKRDFDDIQLRPFGTVLTVTHFTLDAVEVARDLLGRVLVSIVDDQVVAGRIVETEAYLGSDDPGSHAATKGMTKRNAVMYGPAGRAYVYFTYGNHHMLNVVADSEGRAAAVLIRAVEPLVGEDIMSARRNGRPLGEVCNGPGKLAQAFGVDLRDNATVLGCGRLAVLEGERVDSESVRTTGRVGLSAGHELPLRFYIDGSPFVSRGRIGPPRASTRRRGGSHERRDRT